MLLCLPVVRPPVQRLLVLGFRLNDNNQRLRQRAPKNGNSGGCFIAAAGKAASDGCRFSFVIMLFLQLETLLIRGRLKCPKICSQWLSV